MKRDKFEKWMTSYLENDLSESEIKEFEAFIAENEDERAYFQFALQLKKYYKNIETVKPTTSLQERFNKAFLTEIDTISNTKQQEPSIFEKYLSLLSIHFAPRKLAYTALVLCFGIFIGNWFSSKDDIQLVQLQEQIKNLESSIKFAQLNSQSPADRIQAIAALNDSNEKNYEVINVLSEKVQNDDNSHVQLAALSALKNYSKDPYAKEKMVNTLLESDELFLKILLMQIIVEWDRELVKKEAAIILSKDTLATRYRTILNKII